MANPDDLTFSLLPSDDPIISPEENLRLAANEALDTTLTPVQDVEETAVAIGRGWAFDFSTGQFRQNGDSPAQVAEEEQLKVWIEKTIYTERFAHEVYSPSYGVEGINDLIASANPASGESLIRTIGDALKVHDHIEDVTNFTFTRDGEVLEVGFRVRLTNGSSIDVPLAVTVGG